MKRFRFSSFMLVAGLLFIYLPMLILVIYSFNESKLVTVWGGWSIKWYVGLLDNTQLMGSVARSLEIACYTAVAAVALGTLAAFVLTRISQFKGRTLFGGLVTAPLVMPEVITGLSLLLLFVAMAQMIGWPQERGIVTIWIAHTTFCAAYVAVVVSARLRELDLSIEEAAMDLGARPWKVFFLITIPMIAPSLAAGGMMSFALSLDDLVLASFVSGPGSTTLPMEVFSAVRLGVKPEINAVASLILLAVSLVTFLVWFFSRRAEEHRKKAIQQAIEEAAADGWQQPDKRRAPAPVLSSAKRRRFPRRRKAMQALRGCTARNRLPHGKKSPMACMLKMAVWRGSCGTPVVSLIPRCSQAGRHRSRRRLLLQVPVRPCAMPMVTLSVKKPPCRARWKPVKSPVSLTISVRP